MPTCNNSRSIGASCGDTHVDAATGMQGIRSCTTCIISACTNVQHSSHNNRSAKYRQGSSTNIVARPPGRAPAAMLHTCCLRISLPAPSYVREKYCSLLGPKDESRKLPRVRPPMTKAGSPASGITARSRYTTVQHDQHWWHLAGRIANKHSCNKTAETGMCRARQAQAAPQKDFNAASCRYTLTVAPRAHYCGKCHLRSQEAQAAAAVVAAPPTWDGQLCRASAAAAVADSEGYHN